jgi:hypothetical protein
MENFSRASLDKPQDFLRGLEEKVHSFAESLGRFVDSLENVATVARRFFGIFRQQEQNLVHLIAQGAAESMAPAVNLGREALGRGKELGGKIVSKGRAHPVAVVAGTLAVIGGIALIAYYLRHQTDCAPDQAEDVA